MSGAANVVVDYGKVIRNNDVASDVPATANLIRQLAGKATWLYVMTTGDPLDGEGLPIPLNPQGTLGHDHSGPPYGSALKHLHCGMSGRKAVTSEWSRQSQVTVGGTSRANLDLRLRPWIRPFQADVSPSLVAPYSRGEVQFKAYLSSAGSVDVTIEILANGNPLKSETASVTSTSEARFSCSNFVDLVPGYNNIHIVMSTEDASIGVVITSLSINNYQKRTH